MDRPYRDPSHEGNSEKYRSGRTCIERDCDQPAGTMWGPYWCVQHNIERMDRIDARMSQLAEALGVERDDGA